MLGKGNVQLDGESLIILDNETGEEFSIELKDKKRILETISALADANADKSKKLERGREDNDRLKRRIVDLQEEVGNEIVTNHDEIETCYMVIGSTFKRLNLLLQDETTVRVAQFEGKSLRVLAAQYQQLNNIIAAKMGETPGAASTDSEEDRLASLLDDED